MNQKNNGDSANAEKNQEETKKKTKREERVEMITDKAKSSIKLFKDELNEAYARVKVYDHHEIYPLRSNSFIMWLKKLSLDYSGSVPGKGIINDVVDTLECHAIFSGKTHELFNRVALTGENERWCDLCNKQWQGIKITKEGWSIQDKMPTLFTRQPHQQSQVYPDREGDIKLLDKFLNLKEEKYKVLVYVHLITAFIVEIPHSAMMVYGNQGSSKSTLFKMCRSLIDPSAIDIFGSTSKKELIQNLNANWVGYFDNIGSLRNEISDLFCRVITGASFAKRKLYTDNDSIIYKIQRVIGLNGINLAATQPDILERSILIELKEIAPCDRRDEEDFWKEFNELKPKILGGILDVLSAAMKLKPDLKFSQLPRMADFAKFGEIILQVMGYRAGYFFEIYKENGNEMKIKCLEDDAVATAIIELMKHHDSWEGTATELLKQLTILALSLGIIKSEGSKMWVGASHALTRKINIIKPNFSATDIRFIEVPRKNDERKIKIIRKK